MSRSPGQQGGRTRTTGTGKLPKQFKRVTVSFQHKLSRLLHIEPDWELLSRLLDEVPVIRHVVDPNRDIDTLAAVE
ncbi:hypothetical protein PHYSODRAFT_500788 [Phytophthora sojae]|uniref:Uncharacterized protein n=1 Tax=Phytophthora sojae (strain P6497) TaxID=1094619 RepID=G4ZH88_PHYSP|nr:hypothetical protein PHYSODRAFT_500788 [Phytophthora sojae]EGZ17137.1 hypothetical protein PHYSODRAFT_500788 [Phytophthora sojae]|eukprot:XP_009526195.1 hypothetical protein PHYSODRAFT_500788 [Phytophthora sojae]